MMERNLEHSSINQEHHFLWKLAAKIIIRFISAGLAIAFGFWLFLASTLRQSYLPNMCNGCLDFWIRLTMVGIGAVIWTATAFWFGWFGWFGRYAAIFGKWCSVLDSLMGLYGVSILPDPI